MAADVPSKEPLEFRAGDTVLWTKSLSDYPANAGWALTYYLVGASRKLTIVATADGADFSVTIPKTDTATLEAGFYSLVGVVTSATETFTIGPELRVQVLPNFASDQAVQAGYDGRSFNRRVRDGLRAMIEGSAEFPEIAYTIFGERNVQLIPWREKNDALALYESKVAQEERQDAANRGERTGVYFKFTRPR